LNSEAEMNMIRFVTFVPEHQHEHGDHAYFFGFDFTNCPWRQHRPEIMASRPLSSVRPRAVHYLPGTGRS